MSDKRTDYISWDEYFMGVAKLASLRSKDPSTQVGACIVDKDNYILSVGYNGFPIGCDDEEFPWAREGGTLDTKALIQKRIGKVVYFDDKYHDADTTKAARKMLDAAGIKYEKYQPSGRKTEIDL